MEQIFKESVSRKRKKILNTYFQIKLKQEEKDLFRKEAKKENLSLSAWIRCACLLQLKEGKNNA